MGPYLLMSVFYAWLAVLLAADATLVHLNALPGHLGLTWLRVHLITIGMVTQALFGVLPVLAANRLEGGRRPLRWDIWLLLNIGLLALIIGIPLLNAALIVVGGTLVFMATVLLVQLLRQLRPAAPQPLSGTNDIGRQPPVGGRNFFIAGLVYLLVGILAGTGLFLGWAQPLRMAAPAEIHIHANVLGFMSLVFAGLLVDLYPRLFGCSLASPTATRIMFWLLTLGALGLVAGPWVRPRYAPWFTGPGLGLYLAATLWLLINFARPLRGRWEAWGPGPWHIITAYFWFLAPVLTAPVILLLLPDVPRATIEANAPQVLVYGWLLNFSYALLPYLLRRAFWPKKRATLGGNWFSLITVHGGGLFLWVSIFLRPWQGPLRGVAYGLWVVSLIPVVIDLWRTLRAGLQCPMH